MEISEEHAQSIMNLMEFIGVDKLYPDEQVAYKHIKEQKEKLNKLCKPCVNESLPIGLLKVGGDKVKTNNLEL